MKKIGLTLFALILSTLISNNILAQDKNLTVSFNWSRISTWGSNQLAIWVEDVNGNHVHTLFATEFTADGGYKKRPVSLGEWTSKFNIKNASKEDIDAVSGATPKAGPQIFTWNCKDKSGKILPAGTYVVRMEANIHFEDKMFFKGEIKIGEDDQKTTGEITYSKPELASGNVLFKDVVVEYK